MKPVRFKGWNTAYAEDQPEYLPLPGYKAPASEDPTGNFTSCWKLTFLERLKVLFSGRFYFSVWTFNNPLQPQRPYVENPLTPEQKAAGRPLDWTRPEETEPLCENCGHPASEHYPPALKCPK